MGPTTTRVTRGALVALALLATLVPIASAHANLASSEPAGGTRLDAPPTRVVVVLTERVDPSGSGLEVLDRSGQRVDRGDLNLDNQEHPRLEVSLPSDLPPGAYSIRWYALSSVDQHTTSGTVGFAVGAYAPPASTTSGTDEIQPRAIAGRFFTYGGLCLVFAAAAFTFWIDKVESKPRAAFYLKALRVGATSHFIGVTLLAYQTWTATGVPIATFLDGEVGRLLALRLVLGTIAIFLLLIPDHPNSTWAGAGAGALVGAGLIGARFGHASTHGLAAMGVQFLHLVSIGTWIGCLVLYVFLLVRRNIWSVDPWTAKHLGHRFSVFALVSVIVMATTGVILSVWILGPKTALDPVATASSLWGKVLYGKVLIAAAMIAVASVNRYVFLAHEDDWVPMKWYKSAVGALTGRAFAPLEDVGSLNVFRSLVASEAAMGVCVLFLASLLTTLGAPYQAGAPPPFRIEAAGDSFDADVFLEPAPKAGEFSTIRFYLNDTATGEPMKENSCGREQCITLFLAHESATDNASEERRANLTQDGAWEVPELLFLQTGNYTVTINVQTAYVFLDTIEFKVRAE